jgi:hypothetical protein
MTPPKLQPPGAGLPFFSRLAVRWFGRRMLRRKFTWNTAPASVEATALRMLAATAPLDDETFHKPVLVPPTRGLEDSSRYWSPAMVLEHLVITAPGFLHFILALSRGETSDKVIDIAAVKPQGRTGRAVEAEFRELHSGVADRIARDAGRHRWTPTHRHPWFGDLGAGDWSALFAVHLLLHEKQLEKIVETRRAQQLESRRSANDCDVTRLTPTP